MASLSKWLTTGPVAVKTAMVVACANPVVAFTAAVFGIYHLNKALSDNKERVRLGGQAEKYENSQYFCTRIERWLMH